MGRVARIFLQAGPGANMSCYTVGSVQVLGSGPAAQSAEMEKSKSNRSHTVKTQDDVVIGLT